LYNFNFFFFFFVLIIHIKIKMNNQFCVAIEHNYLPEDTISLYDIVKKARDNGHDVAAVNIVNPKYARALKDINEIGPFKRDDIVVQTTGNFSNIYTYI